MGDFPIEFLKTRGMLSARVETRQNTKDLAGMCDAGCNQRVEKFGPYHFCGICNARYHVACTHGFAAANGLQPELGKPDMIGGDMMKCIKCHLAIEKTATGSMVRVEPRQGPMFDTSIPNASESHFNQEVLQQSLYSLGLTHEDSTPLRTAIRTAPGGPQGIEVETGIGLANRNTTILIAGWDWNSPQREPGWLGTNMESQQRGPQHQASLMG